MLLADNIKDVFGTVTPPPELNKLTGDSGAAGLSFFIGRVIQLLFIAGSIGFVFMFITGAFQWITSGGEKEGVSKARGRIVHALIGITLLALSFLILGIIGKVLGFNLFDPNSQIP